MRDIDEYTTEELAREITRRVELWRHGKCSYCKSELMNIGGSKACRCKFGNVDILKTYHNPYVLSQFQYGD